jgi:hypothetical protein
MPGKSVHWEYKQGPEPRLLKILTHYQTTVSGVEHVLLAGLDLSPLVGPEEGGQAAIVAQQVKTFRQFGQDLVFWDLIY